MLVDPGGLSPVDPAMPVPASGTLALAVFLQPHPAMGRPSGPNGQGASRPGGPGAPMSPLSPFRPRLPLSPYKAMIFSVDDFPEFSR